MEIVLEKRYILPEIEDPTDPEQILACGESIRDWLGSEMHWKIAYHAVFRFLALSPDDIEAMSDQQKIDKMRELRRLAMNG